MTISGDKGFNGGRPTNIPSLWLKDGFPYVARDEDEATRLAKESGLSFPPYPTTGAANSAAQLREDTWQLVGKRNARTIAPLYARLDRLQRDDGGSAISLAASATPPPLPATDNNKASTATDLPPGFTETSLPPGFTETPIPKAATAPATTTPALPPGFTEEPLWTQERPFMVPPAKTQQEFEEQVRPQIEGLPPGSVYKTPDGKLYQTPKAVPGATDVETGSPIDYGIPGAQEVKPSPGPSAVGAAVRGAVRGAAPAVGGLAAGAALGEAGSALGLLAGPAAPVAAPVGALAGFLVGSLGGGYAVSKAQEAIFQHLPDWAVSALGQLPQQQQADIAGHPIAAFAGELAPNLAMFSPRAAAEAAAPYAESIVARLMQNPIVKRLIPATIMGGQEAGSELASGEPLSPAKIGVSAGAGALMQRPNALGERVMGMGTAPMRAAMGRTGPEPGGPAYAAAQGGPGTPPPAPPPVGSFIDMPDGARYRVDEHTPDGITVLRSEDGTPMRTTTANVIQRGMTVQTSDIQEVAPPLALPAPTAVYGPENAAGTPGFTMQRGETSPIETPPAEVAATERAKMAAGVPPTGNEIPDRLAADQAEIEKGAAPAPAARPVADAPPAATPELPTSEAAPAPPQAPAAAAGPEIGGVPAEPPGARAEPSGLPEAQATRPAEPTATMADLPPDQRVWAFDGRDDLVYVTGPVAESARGTDEFNRQHDLAEQLGGFFSYKKSGSGLATYAFPDEATAQRFLTGAAGATKPPASLPPPAAAPPHPNGPTVTAERHTKSGEPLFMVRFPQRPDIEDLSGQARRMGGQWSSYQGGGMQKGWRFKTQEAADKFADWARGKMVSANFAASAEAAGRAAFAAGAKRVPANDPAMVQLIRQHGRGKSNDIITGWLKGWDAANIAEPVPGVPTPGAGNLPEPAPGWTEIGQNHLGQMLYEDQRGVRSIVQNGVRRSEPVSLRPTRGGVEIGVDRTDRPEYQIATSHPANPRPVEYQPPSAPLKPDDDNQRYAPTGEAGWEPLDEYGEYDIRQGTDESVRGVAKHFIQVRVNDQASGITTDWFTWHKNQAEVLDNLSIDYASHRYVDNGNRATDPDDMWAEHGQEITRLIQAKIAGEMAPAGTAGAPALEPPTITAEPTPATRAARLATEIEGGVDEAAHPQIRLANMIARKLALNEPIHDIRTVQDAAESVYGGTMASGKFTRADLYDAMELGVNRYIAAHPDEFDPRAPLPFARRIARELEDIKKRLPTQTVRAGEKDSMQQFSTPPDYSYAVAWTANIGERDSVLEPSAGTGSLVAPAMNAHPREVIVNELSANRAPLVESLGPDRAFRENAEQLHNILPADVRPSVVVMNPPFSQTAGRLGDKTVLMAGAQHIEQALARLAPGGRLVAIVGRGMKPYTGSPTSTARFGEGTGATYRTWWDRIGRQYDVRANVGVSGSVYAKYGTNFATRLLVIDKNPPSGRAPVVADVESIADLMDHLDGVRNDRQPATAEMAVGPAGQQVAAQPGGAPPPAGGQGPGGAGLPLPRPTTPTGVRGGIADTGAGAGLPGGPGIGGEPAARPEPLAGPGNAVVPQQPERGGPVGTERQPAPGVGGRPELAGSGAEPDAMVLQPEGQPGAVLPPSPPSGVAEGPLPEVIHIEEQAANPETAHGVTEEVYEAYKPQRITIKGAVEHPTKLVQSAAMASVMPPDTKYTPKLPAELITSGKLSSAQLEGITYAGHAHSQMLPANEGEPQFRRGFYLGDSTGVGKGREVAGTILDNWLQGRHRALWVSESRTLIKDAQRDWEGLGRNPKDIFDVGKAAKPGADIKMDKGIGFLTYDTLKGYERQGKDAAGATVKGQTRVDQIIKWLGKDFDGVIAWDEAHALANSIQTKGTRGLKDAAAKALAGIELQQKLPNARVLYVSATGATEVMNLAYAERLGLWGRGTAFPNKQDFIAKISSGGVAAMELVARDMKAMGSYISRSLSYDGVEYDRVEHKLTPSDRQIYDELAGGWQEVLARIDQALGLTGPPGHDGNPEPSRSQRMAAMSAFWSAHQRFFNQIITSLQMPSVIRGIEQDLKEGKQAVLQLVNTNEAAQQRALSRAKAEEGDLEDLDMTPRDQLLQFIDKSFPTVKMEKYIDENGNERERPVTDSAGNLVHDQEALAMKDALLSKLGSIRVPEGPLEMLINHFGTDKVAEITGRKSRVVRKMVGIGHNGGPPMAMRSVEESRPGSANITEADAFQDAKKPILVFSQAGMTGRSYHADLSSPSAGARRSHYLVQAGWRADKALQGFGRTHRTNQASAPIFHLVTTDIEGQRRFISSIARRLAQLGALTKGERRAGESGMFSARDNLESNEARNALAALWRDIQNGRTPTIDPRDFQQQTGLKFNKADGIPSEPPEITTFLNRLLSLKYDMQNHVFGEFADRLNTAIDRAAAEGTLDVGTETLKADKIAKVDDRVVYTDPHSGAETRYVRLKVSNKVTPKQFGPVTRGLGSGKNVPPRFFVESKQTGKLHAVFEARDVTDAKTGQIIPQYRLVDPLDYRFVDRHKIDGRQAAQYWERVGDIADAGRRWNRQLAALPEYREHDEHLITGAILPIWDRLGPWPRVYRLQTDTGERLLGRTVDNSQIEGVLKALGVEGTGRVYAPAEVAAQVMQGGRATLANGWTLSRPRIAGENRIELVGPDFRDEPELRAAGVFSERIGYSTRYFVPTGEAAAPALTKIMERRPVTEMTGGEEGGGTFGRLMRSEEGSWWPFGRPTEEDRALGDRIENEPSEGGGIGHNGGPPLGEPPAPPEQRRADLNRIMHTDDRGLMDRMRETVQRVRDGGLLALRQYWLDQLASLENAEKGAHGGELMPGKLSPTMSARFAKNWHSTLDVALKYGQVRYNAETGVMEMIPGSTPLRGIFAQLSQDQRANTRPTTDDFAMWAIVKRAERLMAEGREHNVPRAMIDRYRNIDQGYILPDGTNLFEKVHADLQAWHKNLLDLGEAAGLFSRESRQLWEHDDYIPFYRALDDDKVSAPRAGGRGIANARSPIKELKGGEAKINNVYENTILNASAMIRRSMANIAAQKTRDFLIFNTDTLTPMSKEARVPYGDPVVQRALRDAGLDPAALTEAAKQGARDLFGALKRRDPDVISVMDNGKPNYYRVNDPLMLQSLTASGTSSMNALLSILAPPARVLRGMVVHDPAFMAAHAHRMALHAWNLTGTSYLASMAESLKQYGGPSEEALRLMAAGALSGRYDVDLPRKVRTAIASPEYQASLIDTPVKAAKAMLHLSEAAMQASDIGARIAVYKRALAQNPNDPVAAMNAARDLLDFSTHGAGPLDPGAFNAAMFLTQTVPFLNARWQGMARTYRGFMGKDRNAILMRGALITAATIALWYANKDDPEYQRKEDWDRQYAWQIKIAPGTWLRIPKHFELGALFGSVPEMIAEYMHNGSTRELGNAAGALFTNVFKFNIVPIAIRAPLEAWMNKDTYTGQPIVNEREKALVPDMQYGPADSPSVIALTHAYNSVSPVPVAPAVVQHLLRGYLAGWSSYITAATDYLGEQTGALPAQASPSQIPVAGRFVHTEPEAGNRISQDFYDLKNQMDAVGRSIRAAEKDSNKAMVANLRTQHPEYNPAVQKSLDRAGTALSKLGGVYQRAEMNPNLSKADKTAARDRYYNQRDRLLDQIKPMLRRAQGLPAQ